MFGRRREIAQQISADVTAAQQSLARAESKETEVVGRWNKVQSIASTIADRRQRNGFGEDYEITKLAPRG